MYQAITCSKCGVVMHVDVKIKRCMNDKCKEKLK